MSNPINNSITQIVFAQFANMAHNVVHYAGRVWKWLGSISSIITDLFFSKKPPGNGSGSPSNNQRNIQPISREKLSSAGVDNVASDIIGEPELAVGPQERRRGLNREGGPLEAPKAVIPVPTPIADKLVNARDHWNFTQIRVMNQRDQIEPNSPFPIGDEACGYQSFKNALVGMALGMGAQIPGDTFEDESVYYFFYDFMKKYRQSEQPGFRDIPVSFMPRILGDFAKLKTIDFNRIPDAALREKIKAIHKSLIENPNSVSMFNVSQGNGELLLTDVTTLTSLANLKEVSQRPGPFNHAFVMGAGQHWTALIMEKDVTGTIKWFGCDSWPGSPTSILSNNIETLELALVQIDTVLENGYNNSVGVDFKRLAGHFDAAGLPKQEQLSQHHIGSMLVGNEDYFEKIANSYRFMQRAGWLNGTANPKIKGFINDLKVLTNYLKQFNEAKLAHIAANLPK